MGHFAGDQLADTVLIFLIYKVFLIFHDFGDEVLAEGENLPALEILQTDVLHHLFAHFKVGLNLDRIRQGNLCVFVLHLSVFHNLPVALDLQIPAVHIDNDVKVGVRTVFLQQHRTENVLQNAHQRFSFNIFEIFELRKGFNQI